jgi:hypothetical protein
MLTPYIPHNVDKAAGAEPAAFVVHGAMLDQIDQSLRRLRIRDEAG